MTIPIARRSIQAMGIAVLGPLVVDGWAPSGRRDRVVLAALALATPQPLSSDRMAEALWPNRPPASAAKVVQGCVARLRAELGGEAIVTTVHGYALGPTHADLDVHSFEREVSKGREHHDLGQFDRGAWTLGQALARWRGAPYPDLVGWEPAVIEATRLSELALQAEELRAECLLQAGQLADAQEAAQAVTTREPLRERAWSVLATTAYREGRQADALEVLRRHREILRDELGIHASATIDDLEVRILRHDPALIDSGGPEGRQPSGVCPWPGLRAYDVGDADTFFGREAEIRSAVALLSGRGVLAVVGPSGVGKSSLIRAGVVPALASGRSTVAVLTPGASPSADLPAADLLVVDQCEEAFSLCQDPAVRHAFLEALAEHAQGHLLVLSLRADHMADVATHAELARLVEQGLFLLGPLTETGVRAAIEKPLAAEGLLVEPGLVDLLVRDWEGGPGALPLLGYALAETWARREGRTLTVDGYRDSGGVRGAVAQSAERMYAELDRAERTSLRAVMSRLVSAGPEGEPVAARVPRALVAGDPAQVRLVEGMVASRLLTADESMVTLAHEALVRAWPRLRRWLDDDVEGRRILHHLAAGAEAWDSLGRPDSELYRGVRLSSAMDWSTRSGVELVGTERDFLAASQRLADEEDRSAEARADEQARVNRRLRLVVAGLVTALLAASVSGAVALRQSRRASVEAVAADAGRVGARAQVEADAQQSLLLAAAGARLDPGSESNANLTAVLARRPQLIGLAGIDASASLSHVTALDAGVLVTDRTHHVWSLSEGLDPGPAEYQAGGDQGDNWQVPLVWSASQDVVAVAASPEDDLPIRLLDPKTLEPDSRQLGGWPDREVAVADLAVSGDGRFLAATLAFPEIRSQTDGSIVGATAVVWDLATPGRPMVRRLPISQNFFNGVALDARGRTLFLTNPVSAWDVRTGRRLWTRPRSDFSLPLAVQPRGRLLAVVSPDDAADVMVLRADSGREVMALRGHEDRVLDIQFSPDGTTLAAAGQDGLAVLWESASGAVLGSFEAGPAAVTGVSYTPDGRTLVSVTGDNHQVQAWDLEGQRSFLERIPLEHAVPLDGGMERVDHAGRRVAAGGQTEDGLRLRVLDTADDSVVDLRTPESGWFGAGSWRPDSRRYAAGYAEGLVEVLDVERGAVVASRTVLDTMVVEVSYASDGGQVMAADDDGGVVLLDGETLEPLGERVHLALKPYALSAGPDGHTAFVAAGGTEWAPFWDVPITHGYLVDLDTGEVVWDRELELNNIIYSAFSPRGDRIALGGRQGEVMLIDAASGRAVSPPTVAHDGDVYWVSYNDDGTSFTSGSNSADVAVWDGRTGQLLARTRLPKASGLAVAGFRPDGTLLVTSFGGEVYDWDPSPSHTLDFACQVAGRDLTRAEWAAVFPTLEWRSTCPE